MSLRLFMARPLPSTGGETHRVVHLFPVPTEQPLARLKALCGAAFGLSELELLKVPSGMPCESCLRNTPPLDELPEGE